MTVIVDSSAAEEGYSSASAVVAATMPTKKKKKYNARFPPVSLALAARFLTVMRFQNLECKAILKRPQPQTALLYLLNTFTVRFANLRLVS